MKSLQLKRAFRAALLVLLVLAAGLTKTQAQSQGAIPGLFSVSADKQVLFSQGNLQYQASTGTWRFAEHQYDFVGEDNANISSTYDGWIDLFGWGTSGWDCGNTYYHPWDSDNSNGYLYGPPGSHHDLTGDYANSDWGVYNAISNGGNQAGLWRTLTAVEWDYLLNMRSTSSGLRFANAEVSGLNGVIVFPDSWNGSFYTPVYANLSTTSYSTNVIATERWATLEQAGAVFLPAAGRRDGTSVYSVGSEGGYWSSGCNNASARFLRFTVNYLYAYESKYRYNGQSVRLVCHAEDYSLGIIQASPNPAGGGVVSGYGAYQQGAECTLMATPAAGFTFVNWTENGVEVSTNAQYTFTVSGHRWLEANFSNPTLINFADANVKALCVANWDTDNDGELNCTEAAAVTNLGMVFQNNTDIATFNELQYFIGLDAIPEGAFSGCTSLTSITLPSLVSSIGNNAFGSCTALSSVYYTGDVAGWCGIQFGNEYSNPLTYAALFYINNELVRNLVIPNGVTSIGDYAFSYCRCLNSLTMPNTVTSIGNYAFYNCSGLVGDLALPNALTNIGDYAFFGCSGLTGSLTLPNTLTSLGSYAFDGCSGFTGSLTLPNALTIINEYTFFNCSGFTGSLTLPESLETIGCLAFGYCSHFTGALIIPNMVNTIVGNYYGGAFYYCHGFTSVVIPNSVMSIGGSAFFNCTGLISATIGTNVNQIGEQAFGNCINLREVNYNAINSSGGFVFNYCNRLNSINLGDGVVAIPDGLFSNSSIQVIKSAAVNPPVITNNVFSGVSADVTLYVPCESKAAYQADAIWGNFTNYQDSAFELVVESEDEDQGTVSIEQHGTCDDPTCIVKANPKLHYGFVSWLKNGQVVSTDRTYTFNLEDNTTLTAHFEPSEVITNYWTASNFKNYKPVKGIITIDGVEQFSDALEVGAFCGDECRASVCAMWFPPTEQYVVNLTIGTDLDNGNELITFRIYDHQLNQELNVTSTSTLVLEDFNPVGTINNWFPFSFSHEVSVTTTVNPVGAGTVSGAGDYLPGAQVTLTATPNTGFVFDGWIVGGQTVSVTNPYTFTVSEAVNVTAHFNGQQSQALVSGWNWWSTYIEQDGIDGLTMLENSLGHDGSLIMTQGINVENYYSQLGYDYWWGNLASIQNEKGYKIMVSGNCSAVLTGAIANPANHPITIQPNWNWIGYPCSASQFIANATFQPSDGDVVVSQGSNATYYAGYGWWPDFVMEPGKSYQYYSTDANTKSLVFSNVREGDPQPVVKDGETHWTARNFKNYKAVKGIITIDGVEQFRETLEVGAFCGDECRASVCAMYFPPTQQYVVNLTIGTDLDNGSELITFRIYDHETEQELNLESTSTLTLNNFDPVGTINNWFPFSFVSPVIPAFHFTTAGNWSEASNWSGNALPGATDEVFIDANCILDQDAEVTDLTVSDGFVLTLQSGKTLAVTGNLTNTASTGLVVKDGAQLLNASASVAATVEKDITAYLDPDASEGWYTIASPVDEMTIAGSDFLTETYDLFRYVETNMSQNEWENYRGHTSEFTVFENGRGYLYANSNTFSPAFTGTLNNATVSYNLTYTNRPDDDLDGFNLIGNPFPHNIYKGSGAAIDNANLASGFYTLNDEGVWHVHTYKDAILPGQGILVKTSAAIPVSIAKSAAAATAESSAKEATGLLEIGLSGMGSFDRTFVYFNQGVNLTKMENLNDNLPSLYIGNDEGDFAIAHTGVDTESLDLMFKNRQTGQFALNVAFEGLRFSYLHLIDRVAGTDTDLLASPSYSFAATGQEDEARFKLMFKVMTGVDEFTEEAPFAFISDGNLIVTGDGMLQVFDILGHQLVSKELSTPHSSLLTPNFPAGVYVLRLVNGESVRTQKIVVK